MPQPATDLVKAARSQIENLDVQDVKREIAEGDVVLVDIRESDERDRSGAI